MCEAALFALGRTAHRDAMPALIEALRARGESLQTLACLGLAQIGDPRAVPKLSAVVADTDAGHTARAACAFALGHIGDRAAAPVVIGSLAHGKDELQRLAAWALGRMGVRAAVPALLDAYFRDRKRLHQTASWALARIEAGKIGPLPRDPGDLRIEFT